MDPSSSESPQPQSKSAQKRAVKAARLDALKLVRRTREKQRRKEARKPVVNDDGNGDGDQVKQTKPKDRKTTATAGFGARVVIDLSFDELMSDKEIKSLCSQLAYVYSTNRRSDFPFMLLCTALGGRTQARLDALGDHGYRRWAQTEWRAEGYESLWEERLTERTSFVYLTADSEDELSELMPGETYVIGGLCDHNRYKNMCLNKARSTCVRTARLPIGRYISANTLQTRKILTVNQVFEILVRWVEKRDWQAAFYDVIPKRKFQNAAETTPQVADDGSVSMREIVIEEPESQDRGGE